MSVDKEHGKPDHICSTLCGAGMFPTIERNDGVMDMTYRELELAPYFDDEAIESYLDDDIESGAGEPEWVNL